MTEPLDNYQPRKWEIYTIQPEEGMGIPTRPAALQDLVSSSKETARLAELDGWDVSKVFYTDFEQMAAGHDLYGSGPVFELTEEYMGHPEGALGFVSYEGMAEEPRTYRLWLEIV